MRSNIADIEAFPTPSVALKRMVGVEVERWAYSQGQRHVPADISVLMPMLEKADPAWGRIVREPGPGSIEFAGHYASTVREAVENIRRLDEFAAKFGLIMTSSMCSPFTAAAAGPAVRKVRYQKLWEALRQEVPASGGTEEDAKCLDVMNRFAATHAHFSFDGYTIDTKSVDERIVFVINVLNRIGPRVARVISTRCRQRNVGHLGIWSRWADPRRFSAYGTWFTSFADMKARFESLPRLVRCVSGDKENGDWEVDLVNRLDWSNPDDDGAGWWHFVRARPRLGTFEVRLLPSMPGKYLEFAILALDDLVCHLVSVADQGIGFESAEAFFGSALWREEIAGRPIGAGGLPTPRAYSAEQWRDDVFD